MKLQVAVLALAAAVSVALSSGAAAAPSQPARLQVTATEFTFTLSRGSVPAGRAIVGLVNMGEDDHDLVLRRAAAGARIWGVRTTLPGEFRERSLRLVPGRYQLWCTIADHRARGMRATLRVRAVR